MDILDIIKKRYTAKAYDNTKKIPEDIIKNLMHVLKYSPSSINSQPWHFIIASSEEGKSQIAQSTSGSYSFNSANIINASHVVVLCRLITYQDENLAVVVDQELADKRFNDMDSRKKAFEARRYFVDLHRKQLNDEGAWMEKQVYIALGNLLTAAQAYGVDATPMEGFDAQILDKTLDLSSKGLTSTVIVPLGYHSDEDRNATLPKSRLPDETLFTFI